MARAVYERGGPGIHVPLEGGHALVEVLRAALGREAREHPRQRRQAGRELSAALMEGFLSASEARSQDTFPYLLVGLLKLPCLIHTHAQHPHGPCQDQVHRERKMSADRSLAT